MRQAHYRLPNIDSEIEEHYLSFEDIEGYSGTLTYQKHIDWDTTDNTVIGIPPEHFRVKFRKESKSFELSFWVKSGVIGHDITKSTSGARQHHYEEGRFLSFAQAVYDFYASPEGTAAWKAQTIAVHEAKIAELQADIDYRRSKIAQFSSDGAGAS